MNLSFRIVPYRKEARASLYTFHIDGEEKNEFEWFLTDDDCREHQDFQPLLRRIELGLTKRGFGRKNWFGDEEGVWALYPPPHERVDPRSRLRLYCIRLPNILVAGYGGVKTTRTFQEDERLERAVRELQHVDERLHERRTIGRYPDVWIEGGEIRGNLIFAT